MDEARSWIEKATKVVAFTGAALTMRTGIPADSSERGPWRQRGPAELVNTAEFQQNPRRAWDLFQMRRAMVAATHPSPAHWALANLENRKWCTIITQNVDDLHERAGSRRIIKLNGDIWRLRCTTCKREWTDRRVPLPSLPPACSCGGIARPATVMFDELPAQETLKAAEEAARSTSVFIVIGAMALLQPAASIALVARKWGIRIIEVNPEKSVFHQVAARSYYGDLDEVVPQLLERKS